MFVPFAIEGKRVDTMEVWTDFINSRPDPIATMGQLRLKDASQEEIDFSFDPANQGLTILEWARTQTASYTLMHVIRH